MGSSSLLQVDEALMVRCDVNDESAELRSPAQVTMS